MSETPSVPAAPRRRIPFSLFPVLGCAAALAWGVLGLGLPWGAPLVMLGLGGMTLVLTGRATYRMLETAAGGAALDEERAQASPARVRELEREKQLVLKAIKELDLDHQMRKVSDEDHREMTERYRARALRVMADLEAEAAGDYKQLIERELRARLGGGSSEPKGGSS